VTDRDPGREPASPRPAGRTRLASAIEADLAYFDARLTLIGDQPATSYQEAQVRAFQLLSRQLQGLLARARQGKPGPR
jgi:hypothetical protein